MESILIAVDFSDFTADVIAQGAKLAASFSAKVYLMHVVVPNEDAAGGGVDATAAYPEEAGKLNRLATSLRQQGVEVTAILAAGVASQLILKEAESVTADVIVMGSHGYGSLKSALLGSTSQAIISASSAPVFVVPAKLTLG